MFEDVIDAIDTAKDMDAKNKLLQDIASELVGIYRLSFITIEREIADILVEAGYGKYGFADERETVHIIKSF